MSEEHSILQQLDAIEKLPTLPAVVNQLNQLIASNRSSMAQIASVIARDQAIASRVIRLVNSAFYGLQGRVTSIQQAITLLGLNTVKNLVTGVAVVKAFENSSKSSLFDHQKFWMHTFACAVLSREIARKRRCAEPEDYFMSGLLHDIGILVLDQFFNPQFMNIINACTKSSSGYTDTEQNIIGTTHCEVGEYLANKWHIPEILALSIRYHHTPLYALNKAPSSLDILFTVHISDSFIQSAGYHIGFDGEPAKCSRVILHRLGINESEINPVWEEAQHTIAAVVREWGI
jgi:HD-like signal output (HDOD) protein